MSTASAPKWWTDDLERHNRALLDGGFVLEDEGWKYVSPDAPEQLVRSYTQVVSVGYFNGWL
jgi:hypothetical protein